MTEEHKAKIAAGRRRYHARLRKEKRIAAKQKQSPRPRKPHVPPLSQTPEFAYALGYIEAWLGAYAAAAHLSSEALAAELGTVLRSKSSR